MEWLSTDSDSESESDLDDLDEDPFDEDLGGLDGEGAFDDDAFDEFDDDGQADQELENRIEELEEELGSLSSTVNTVRSENEEISETVHEIEENVRNLLDIYEMVTRGVNPFVDEAQSRTEMDSGAFGLFETDDEQDAEEDLDESVTETDAEEFFDDDFVDPDDRPDDLDDGLADDASPLDDGLADDAETTDDGEDASGDGDGKSFDELKAEYESGEAEWDELDDPAADAGGGTDEESPTDEESLTDEEGLADEESPTDEESLTDEEPLADDGAPSVPAGDGGAAEPVDDADSEQVTSASSARASRSASRPVQGETKPYLDAIPGGYACDLLVLEWMEYLVEEADPGDAARAIEYYESIDWLAEEAAEQLRAYLRGFGGEVETVEGPPEQLTMDHHTESLWYVSRLADGVPEALALDERVERG